MTAVQGEPLTANEGTGWTVDDSEFGARLALVRQRMQWNIKEAARECGVPAATWGLWESGSMPRRYQETCRKIADRTGDGLSRVVRGCCESRRGSFADLLGEPGDQQTAAQPQVASSVKDHHVRVNPSAHIIASHPHHPYGQINDSPLLDHNPQFTLPPLDGADTEDRS